MTGNHIIIENLKGIKKLDFEIPNVGVHVISATNGSGKTTLMHCIDRLVNTRVFNDNFVQHDSWNVDSYDNSKITYRSYQGNQITYTYREQSDSWRPTTRTANTFNDFAYNEIITIPALGDRVYISNETISGGKVKAASNEMRNAMSTVLGNQKFLELRRYKVGEARGRGGANRRKNIAFLLPSGFETKYGSRSRMYYSEGSFSLGEIFTLNLLYQIQTIQNDSLLVIDELEVALHPLVQINLLKYLERKAAEKNLTVIISTHSSSLIKTAKKLIFLKNDGGGIITPHYDCYPTMALQEVAITEDIQPEFVFFVEDDAAEAFLKEKIKYYFKIENRTSPLWKVLPIGGYMEVIRFLSNAHQYLLNNRIGQYAFLDFDVVGTEAALTAKGNARTPAENIHWSLFQAQKAKIKYLSITPELGIWDWIITQTNNCQIYLREEYPDANINLQNQINEALILLPNPSGNPRKDAKIRLLSILNNLSDLTNEDIKRIRQKLFAGFISNRYSKQTQKNNLRAKLGPIFS